MLETSVNFKIRLSLGNRMQVIRRVSLISNVPIPTQQLIPAKVITKAHDIGVRKLE